MPYVKIDKDRASELKALSDEIDKKIEEAVKFAEKHQLKLSIQSGLYIPDSLEGVGIEEDDIPESESWRDYEYVRTEETGWVSSRYHC